MRRANHILTGAVDSLESTDALKGLGQQYTTAPVHARQVEDKRLQSILNELRTKQQITEAQAEAFLCTIAFTGSLQALQAMVLLTALKHQELFGDPSRPLRAMAAFRLLVEDRAKVKKRLHSLAIEQQLPDSRQTLEEWVESLEQIIASLAGSNEKYAQQRLMPILRVFKDVIAGNLENKRLRGAKIHSAPEPEEVEGEGTEGMDGRGHAVDSESGRVFVQDVLESEDGPGYQKFSVQPVLSDETQNPVEHVADHQETGVFLAAQPEKTASASLRKSYALSAMHAKTIAGSIERREKRLMCLTSRLSSYERRILVSELQERLSRCDIAYLLYLALATGRSLGTLLAAERVESFKAFKGTGSGYILGVNDIFFLYRQELPAHRLPREQQCLVNQQSAAVVLSVPCDSQAIRELPKVGEQETVLQATELLKEINRANFTRITLGKITEHLANFLHHCGEDDVLIALVTGNPSAQEAGLFYTQYDTVTLYRTYQTYREFELQAETKEPNESNAKLGGSQLILTEQAVFSIFDHLKSYLLREQSSSWDRIHNSYVMYVLHLLNMATGHRPVRDPFDDIYHVDLVSKKIFISDKESRFTASSARVLVLPNTALLQIELYKEHLKNLFIYMESLAPELAQKIRQALNGKGPLLFLIERGDVESEPKMISMSPKAVESFWTGLIGLPTNWHRHFLRTYLLNEDEIPGEAIDTWMGHARPGQEGLTRYSGMSIKSMANIASRLECLLRRLEVMALSNKGIAHG